MRTPTALSLALLASALVLLGCSADQQPTTAPVSAPNFAKAGTAINDMNGYSFSLSCHSSSPGSHASVNTSSGASFILACGGSETHGAGSHDGFGGFTSFGYTITLSDASPAIITCSQTAVATTGDFKCSSKKWAATLTVTDLGILPPGP